MSEIEDFEDEMSQFAEMAEEAERAYTLDLSRPWMNFHKFHLILKAEDVKELVDRCLEVGICALDLETEGFDNRIEYDATGQLYTRHSIVGYCLGVEGVGYYIPVRHRFEKGWDPNPNVDNVKATEAEITRLCQEAQPILKEDADVDILGATEKDFAIPPRVVIEFWHAKFDQEFLYPVTGIDIWNPSSFEDGMLMSYVLHTDGLHGLKDNALTEIPPVKDDNGDEHHYEMIKFGDLFDKKVKPKERGFYNLTPDTDAGWNVVLYGASDGICTNLLCGILKKRIEAIEAQKGMHRRYTPMYRLEKQVAQVVRIIERCRVLIDKGEIVSLLDEAQRELSSYEAKIVALAASRGFHNFNPASASQMAEFLFDERGLDIKPKPGKTAEQQYKTDEKTLEIYADKPGAPEILGWVIKHRQINKIKGTYLKNLAENTDELDQLRLNFKQTGAATGRFSAPKGEATHGFSGVPMQGIPAKIDPKKPKVAHSLRRTFIARPKYVIVKVDYASQELRITASVSGEKKWINEYKKEIQTGIPADLHFMTAQAFYPGLTADSPDYKLKRGQGKCVHPNTILETNRGPIAIKDLGDFGDKADTFIDLPIADLTVDGDPVVALYNGGVKPLFHVVTRYGVVTCTEEHRFANEAGDLVRVKNLEKGHVLQSPPPPPPPSRALADFYQIEWGQDELTQLGEKFYGLHKLGVGLEIVHHPNHEKPFHLRPSKEGANKVLAVIPAGSGLCLDITLGTKDHLYYANGLLTHNTANFALVYGGGVGAVQRATGCDAVEGARLLQAFHESVPDFSKWVKKQHQKVKKDGGVRTAFGRFIAIPDANITGAEVNRRIGARKSGDNTPLQGKDLYREVGRIKSACERKSTNFPIQGAGADILKISLVLLTRELSHRGWLKTGGDDSVRMIMTVHDEVVFEIREERVAEAIPIILKIMEYPSEMVRWTIPLIAEAEIGSSWAAKLDWNLMLRGHEKHPRPKYLQGVEVNTSPDIWVLQKRSKGSSPPEALPSTASAAPPPASAALPPAPQQVPSQATPEALSPPPPQEVVVGIGGNQKAVYRLSVAYITESTVQALVRAVINARLSTISKTQWLPLEFEDGFGNVVLSALEGHRAPPDELKYELRDLLQERRIIDHG